jgi:hypothetical protein
LKLNAEWIGDQTINIGKGLGLFPLYRFNNLGSVLHLN